MTDDEYMFITGSCTLGYGSAGCKKIRDVVDKKFSETMTVINNIYQPCYHQIIPNAPVPKVLQGRGGEQSF